MRRLAAGHVFYDVLKKEFLKSELSEKTVPQVRARNHAWLSRNGTLGGAHMGTSSEPGAWDTFSTRNIGFRVNERMAREFAGDAGRMRAHARKALERTLHVNTSSWSPLQKTAFDNFALLLTPAAVRSWTQGEKEELLKVIRAKTKSDEMLYLRLTQRHNGLRKALLTLGS